MVLRAMGGESYLDRWQMAIGPGVAEYARRALTEGLLWMEQLEGPRISNNSNHVLIIVH